jgi:hypothetical protein
MEACTDTSGSGCLNGMAFSRSIEPAPASSKTNSATTKINSAIATRTEQPSIAPVRDRPQFAEKKAKPTVIEAKVEAPASGRPPETSDPVIIKAKTTIGAKLEDPASPEFGASNETGNVGPRNRAGAGEGGSEEWSGSPGVIQLESKRAAFARPLNEKTFGMKTAPVKWQFTVFHRLEYP